MKICIVSSSYPLNPNDGQAAAGFFVRDFALGIIEANHQVFILTQAKKGIADDDPRLKVIRYEWSQDTRPLSLLNPLNPADLFKIFLLIKNGKNKLIELIQKEKIDFCLAMWAVPSGYLTYLVNKKFKIPYAVWALGSDIWVYGKYPFFRMILKKVLDHACKLFADGYKLADDVEKLTKNQCQFLPSSRLLLYPNSEIAIDKSKTNFLFIGRYHKNKGIDVLIESINRIPRELLNRMNFYIFGGGKLEGLVKINVKKYNLDKFVFVNGFISAEKLAEYLSSCNCVIIPSRIESIPVILSDSLQMKIPVIVTDVGDMGKLVKEYQTGKVVSPENPEELKNAIIEFTQEDKSQYFSGIEKLGKIFDVKRNALSFLESIRL